MAIIAAGVAIFLIVIGLQGGKTTESDNVAKQATAKADRIADGYGDLAARVAALCQTGGPDVKLDAAELCARAQAAVANPEVNVQPLTTEQVRAIAQAAIAAQADKTTVDMAAVVAQVLAAVRNDSSLRGLDEATVRAIVESTIATQGKPLDGKDGKDGKDGGNGTDGAPGASFLGFQRDGAGNCSAVIATTGSDGTTTTSRSPAGDAACAPVEGGGDTPPVPQPQPPASELPTPDPVIEPTPDPGTPPASDTPPPPTADPPGVFGP